MAVMMSFTSVINSEFVKMSDNNLKSGKTGRSANMTYADKALLIDLARGRPGGGMRDHIVKCAGF